MCGNIFHFHFSVASGHNNADSYVSMNYLWEYFSAAFSVAFSHILLQHWKQYQTSSFYVKTKKMIILWEVNARKVRSTFGEKKHYRFAYSPKGMRRLFYLYVIKTCICIQSFLKANFTIYFSLTKDINLIRRWVFLLKTMAFNFLEINLFLVFFYKQLIFQIYYTCSKFYGTSSM